MSRETYDITRYDAAGNVVETVTCDEARAARRAFWYNLQGDNFRILKPDEKPAGFIDKDDGHSEIDTAEWDKLPF